MRAAFISLALLALTSGASAAQSSEPAEEPAWSLSVTVAAYALLDEGDYAQPTFTADRGALHLEGRYNYEAMRTASLWAGYAMRGGRRVQWELIPMVGGVFGETSGLAPGYEASLGWWKLDAYIEGEYVFAKTSEDRFVYHWSEVAVAPAEWLRAGLVTQRTRAHGSDREIHRGPFVNATVGRLDAAAYVFIRTHRKPTVVWSLGLNF